jgi:transcriptional regulator of acetoin/glycerol metabolism
VAARSPDRTPEHADEALHRALRAAQWNVSEVAREMGLARMTLYRRMKRAGIVPPNRAL